MMSTVLCDVTQYSLVDHFQRLRGSYVSIFRVEVYEKRQRIKKKLTLLSKRWQQQLPPKSL
jgi:hypothetical protein